MRYEFFEELSNNNPGHLTQERMNRLFKNVTQPAVDDRISLNNRLDPILVDCDAEEGSLTLLFHSEPWMSNTCGNMHGGMIATVCDLTMGLLARYYKGASTCVTVHLGIEYVRVVPPEGDIMVKATMEKAGRNVYFLTAKAFRGNDNRLAAIATAEFM